MNFTFKRGLPLIVFFFLFSFNVNAQTSCGTCAVTDCSSVSVSYTYNGNTTNYPNIPWVKGMNVRVAMLSSQQQYGYDFTTTNYCPYGGFLVSYQGIMSGSSSYWELQINGQAAPVGMDFRQLSAGDQVTWSLVPLNKKQLKMGSHQHIMASMHMKNIVD